MKNLMRELKEYKKETILAPVFKLLEAIFDLMVPIIVSFIIDRGIFNSDINYILKMCILLIILAIIGISVSIIAQYFAAKASIGIGTKLREKLFAHIQKFSFKELEKVGESSIINRITNDTMQVQTGINMILRLALRSPFIVFGSLIMAMLINKKIGLIFLLIIPIISFIIFVITKICVPKYHKVQDKKDNLLNIANETLSGSRVIRAFGIEEKIYEEFENENIEYTKIQNNASKISSLMNSSNYLIINLGIIAIIAIGGKEVNIGNMTQGQVVALYNYMFQILIELVKLANLLLLIPKSFASLKRIDELLVIENLMNDGNEVLNSDDIILEFDNVSLNYSLINNENDDSKNALSNISFKVQSGETIGIIGRYWGRKNFYS